MNNINSVSANNSKLRIALALASSLLSFQVVAQQSGGECVALPPPPSGDLPAELGGVKSTLVFEENFDKQADWKSSRQQRCQHGTEANCNNLPDGWDFFYSTERWHPDDGDSSLNPSGSISSERRRGSSGKGYITWDESWGSPGEWGSDATLAKNLPGSYKDLYVEFWLQFQPGYRWGGAGTSEAKLARVSTWSGSETGARFSFNHGGPVVPYQFMGTALWQDLAFVKSTMVCSPQAGVYCDANKKDTTAAIPGQVSFGESYGDGAWHKFAFRTKYNSAPGVADGLLQMWIDDQLVHKVENINYIGDTSSMYDGFNMFMIGGNMHNYPVPDSERLEQWLAYDDVRVLSLSQ